MAAPIETIEDLELRAFKRLKLFNEAELEQKPFENSKWLACSMHYGLCIAIGPRCRFYSILTADIHKQGLGLTAAINFRTIQYYNQKVQLNAVTLNANGTILSVALQTTNGPFVELYDVLCFHPSTTRQPFPIASIRLSSNTDAQIYDLEWNPLELDLFATITSDDCVSVVRCSISKNGPASTNFSTLKLPALCLSWSPKGKQLVVGDTNGAVHQLKPDLGMPAVRKIEPPKDIQTWENQSLACIAICWLSTTEWLLIYKSKQQSQQPPNVSLLVVKKQQPAKWTHFGDVLPTAHTGPLTFCPMLGWHMVFLYSPDCAQVAIFGLRGEHWCRLEFETYDIEMPLAADGRSDTFPIGVALDLNSIIPLLLGDGPDRIQFPPPPMLHLLSSDGLLLPYAIVSRIANHEHRPAINVPPESIHLEHACFGETPHGWVPPQPLPPQTANLKQQQQIESPPSSIQTANLPLTPMSDINEKFAAEQSQRENQRQIEEQEKQQQRKLEQQARVAELVEKEHRQKEQQRKEAEEEQNRQRQREQVAMLEQQLEQSIVKYTQMRNNQAQRISQELHQLRCEIELRASSTDLTLFDKLGNVQNEIVDNLRRKAPVLDNLCKNIRQTAEALNNLRLNYLEWERAKNQGQKEIDIGRMAPPSFDIQKRVELTEQQYNKSLDEFERVKRSLFMLDEQLGTIQQFGHVINQNMSFDDKKAGEKIDPIQQRKLIQTNDNIAKMCTKLGVRLQQIQRCLEVASSKEKGTQKLQQQQLPSSSLSTRRKPMAPTAIADANRVADYCMIELNELDISSSADSYGNSSNNFFDLDGLVLKDDEKQRLNAEKQRAQFQQNLYNYLSSTVNLCDGIRQIEPFRPKPLTEKIVDRIVTDEQALAQKIKQIFSESPAKPQLISIGVQSPDFLQQQQTTIAKSLSKPKKHVDTTSSKTTIPAYTPATTTSTNATATTQPIFMFKQKLQEPEKALSTIVTTTSSAQQQANLTSILNKPAQQQQCQPTSTTLFSSTLSKTTASTTPIPSFLSVAKPATTKSTTVPTIAAATTTPVTTTTTLPSIEEKKASETTTTELALNIQPVKEAFDLKQHEQEKNKIDAVELAVKQPNVEIVSATNATPPVAGGVDEGMEEEVNTTTTAPTSTSTVTFDFMKGISLGASGPNTSTPVNGNRNPFGLISAATGGSRVGGTLFGSPSGSTGGSSAFGTSAFGTPASTFGTPNQTTGTSAFGSFGTAGAASPPSGTSSSAFGSSPFASTGTSAFGAASAFGSASPFASTAKSSPFGTSAFGGGTTATDGSGTLFGGGMSSGSGAPGARTAGTGFGGSGFSAFASKSSAFGQLANKAQTGTGGSLFGGGAGAANTASVGSTTFSGFGGGLSITPTGTGVGTTSPFGQQNSSAFTTFRK